MKVLVLSQYYPPEAVPIPAEVARGMLQRGHSVRVLTAFPNYPDGKVFPGYRQRWRVREMDGKVPVYRVPVFADHSQNPVKRMVNYLSFAISSTTAARYARGADVVYVYATQMTAALGPWLWRKVGGPPYVLHVQDVWPDSILGTSMIRKGSFASLVEKLVAAWCRSVYRGASSVIGIGPSMVSLLQARSSSNVSVELVYNWGDQEQMTPPSRSDQRAGTEIIYAGNVGEMQDLEVAVRAAHAAVESGIRLTIVGGGVARRSLRSLVAELGCSNVVFKDSVPRAAMASLYAEADFGLVPLKDLPVFRATIPSKFQSVLGHGLPVITTVQGDVRALVEGEGVGLTADAGNVSSLEGAFRRAASLSAKDLSDLQATATKTYAAYFVRASGLARIESILVQSSRATEEE
ncbi:glycosyltransferase family 4 protein [Microbacterium sp. LRZ72]|uniref:glycosyltransferase family 4 protein n=1 Tax=Microbacterium sp. LRZ72 TaxID=2942481 RepID=UPI0029B143B2|nr:glycosyltransferase family 4 protein [Microbacterium sp. LRZ72]MDX2377632.1 glycosyltransferase family 4 protein [Microbacterium sp. LRZ72]